MSCLCFFSLSPLSTVAAKNDNGVSSDYQNSTPHHVIIQDSHRPTKIQKVSIIIPINTNLHGNFLLFPLLHQHQTGSHDYEGSSSGFHASPYQNYQSLDFNHQEPPTENLVDYEPLCYYQDDHVQESPITCKNSLIGKILLDKSIHTPSLHSSLASIWGNPQGFKINDMEGKLYQIYMDKE